MPTYELYLVTQYDTGAVYALIHKLEQAELGHQTFRVGFSTNLRDPNMCCHPMLLNGEAIDMIGPYLQSYLHHIDWIDEVQELVVMPQARSLNVGSKLLTWAEEKARQAGAGVTKPFINVKHYDAHRFYLHEGYEQGHFRFTGAL